MVYCGFGGRGVAPLVSYIPPNGRVFINSGPYRLNSGRSPLYNVQEAVLVPQPTIFWRSKDTLPRTATRSQHLPTRKVVAMLKTLLRMEYIN